ncbi:Lrp/AsnC family transcriptional regulator [Sinomicrobium weinanense]|uniref:Lrp/AsnC family transcriptional regulator n=1 Tax=Sinomicrobium weinanense TaxID=2842200 RepID=A0A926JU81_9FLAO|nr:Lrp/AsnC family transcriptional regulator [Sinomicrobium weinanense]MBC9797343.1 Lrp/AsnC family transcriptional regulator [Sinomicrobium weinanense]MBU3124523.1 Lrp/AsnC family transcriptional regulator [Sinomicrobium weinanense]
MKLDEKDLKILALLQEDANISNKELAAATNLTVTPVYERIKKLHAMSLLKKKVFLLDRKKLGLNVMVLVFVNIEKHSEEGALNFMNEIKKFAEVVECLHITGAFDFQLKVYARDIDHFHEFHFKKLASIKNVRHMESHFVMKEVINTTSFPLFTN